MSSIAIVNGPVDALTNTVLRHTRTVAQADRLCNAPLFSGAFVCVWFDPEYWDLMDLNCAAFEPFGALTRHRLVVDAISVVRLVNAVYVVRLVNVVCVDQLTAVCVVCISRELSPGRESAVDCPTSRFPSAVWTRSGKPCTACSSIMPSRYVRLGNSELVDLVYRPRGNFYRPLFLVTCKAQN